MNFHKKVFQLIARILISPRINYCSRLPIHCLRLNSSQNVTLKIKIFKTRHRRTKFVLETISIDSEHTNQSELQQRIRLSSTLGNISSIPTAEFR